MSASAREVAFLTVRDAFGTPPRGSQAAFDYRSRRAELSERDRAFAAELAYGAIKRRRLLDWWLAPALAGKTSLPFSIAEILRLGAYQLLCMDGVAPHAAVNETVGLAMRYGHRGTAGLVNAVLRRLERERPAPPDASAGESPLDALGLRHSLPTWIVERLAERFAEETLEAVCAGMNGRPQYALTVDGRRDVETVAAALRARGAAVETSPYARRSLILDDAAAAREAEAAGDGVVQSESAAMPVDLLDVAPEESTLEYCAGRGNKTLQLAGRLGPEGSLEALELDAEKVERLRERLRARGATAVRLRAGDAREAAGPPVDAILLDAPCSGLGVLGRHPEARWRKRPDDVERLAGAQLELLRAAAGRLRPGGRLVYGVCSTDRREGEGVVEAFLAESADAFARGAPPDRYAPLATPAGDLVVAPGVAGRDGFFLSLLRRR